MHLDWQFQLSQCWFVPQIMQMAGPRARTLFVGRHQLLIGFRMQVHKVHWVLFAFDRWLPSLSWHWRRLRRQQLGKGNLQHHRLFFGMWWSGLLITRSWRWYLQSYQRQLSATRIGCISICGGIGQQLDGCIQICLGLFLSRSRFS